MAEEIDLVVGSGPSGISVATALLARGRKVTLVDGGADLDAEAVARRERLAAKEPEDWSEADLLAYKTPQFNGPEGVAQRYGSTHAQIDAAETFAPVEPWMGLRASHAVGGLSNLWGAALLPNAAEDIDDWPVTAEELAPHYEAVSRFLPVAGTKDRLADLFPAFSMDGPEPLAQSPQAAAILSRLERRASELEADGFVWGRARQAVRGGCKACALCLHGCPWGQVFAAGQAIEALRANPNFTYRPGWKVRAVAESGEGVTLQGEGETLSGARVFLGAGVLETARIMLTSFPGLGPELELKDSQHFFTPLLHAWSPAMRPDRAPHHSLTEIFLELRDGAISDRLIHSQIYTWNEFYAREMNAKYGKLPGLSPLFGALARRLVVAQTFLHSDASGRIALKLNGGKLSAENRPNAETDGRVKAARTRIAAGLRKAGLHALTFAGHAGGPGSSFHVGGSLPMQPTPGGTETDRLGRLQGQERVHVVDASVLSSIPATTITFSVMANAHRIGSEA